MLWGSNGVFLENATKPLSVDILQAEVSRFTVVLVRTVLIHSKP